MATAKLNYEIKTATVYHFAGTIILHNNATNFMIRGLHSLKASSQKLAGNIGVLRHGVSAVSLVRLELT